MLNDLIQEKSLTKYRLSKLSNVPYTTINDICSEKADIRKCTVDTVYKIAEALGITIEELLEPYYTPRPDFEIFKSQVCHQLKEKGDVDFLIDLMEGNYITEYYKKKWYPEALYLLAMMDYISKENNIPICRDYDKMRKCKLPKPVYPASVIAMCEVMKDEKPKEQALRSAIPEFLNYNIIEGEVRNVI